MTSPKPYEQITKELTEFMKSQKGVPWVKPWRSLRERGIDPTLRNAVSNHPYSGINVLSLGRRDFEDPRFVTFRQAKGLGGHVMKGEKGTHVIAVFEKVLKPGDRTWLNLEGQNKLARVEKDGYRVDNQVIPFKDAPDVKPPMVPRLYTVFNVNQCEDLKLPRLEPLTPVAKEERYRKAEEFIQNLGAKHSPSNRAFYSPNADRVHWPSKGAFPDLDQYYATAFHELGHWTGHESRLDRPFGREFGSPTYAKEELVAELTSAFLCQKHGINGTLSHSGRYLNSWIKVLEDDPTVLVKAEKKAQEAVAFLEKPRAKEKTSMPALTTKKPEKTLSMAR